MEDQIAAMRNCFNVQLSNMILLRDDLVRKYDFWYARLQRKEEEIEALKQENVNLRNEVTKLKERFSVISMDEDLQLNQILNLLSLTDDPISMPTSISIRSKDGASSSGVGIQERGEEGGSRGEDGVH
ncbi:uncharacterized protein LOC143855720 [Tasmannia lanceolata]|uniref:uncharacterized protein LOC143855720 n=1 Tax=Tasmannia lanceolata TaxID=3420 RepID=UPI004062EDB5